MNPQTALHTDPKTCNKNLICMRTSTIMTIENKQVIDSKGPLKNGFESQKRKDEIHSYKIKALKDREYRNKLLILEREARLTLAQAKLNMEHLMEVAPNLTQKATE